MSLDFRNGCAIVDTTMTDKFHYQDVFKTINIPKPERRLALQAKNLFDSAIGVEPWDPYISEHLQNVTDSEDASQSFWEFQNNDQRTFNRLILTLMSGGLTIALEHRRLDQNILPLRQSLYISRGASKVYTSGPRAHNPNDPANSSESTITSFKDSFYDVTANLGLYNRIKDLELEIDQNESSAAILASAA